MHLWVVVALAAVVVAVSNAMHGAWFGSAYYAVMAVACAFLHQSWHRIQRTRPITPRPWRAPGSARQP